MDWETFGAILLIEIVIFVWVWYNAQQVERRLIQRIESGDFDQAFGAMLTRVTDRAIGRTLRTAIKQVLNHDRH